jgi:hypothetical protein
MNKQSPAPWRIEGENVKEALENLLDEYEDRRAQFGNDILWQKHEDINVIKNARLVLNRVRL